MRIAFVAMVVALGAPTSLVGQLVETPLVIRDVTLIDASGVPPAPHTTLVIRGRRIAALGPASEVAIPDGSRIIEGQGQFVIPGLWDLHVHAMREGRSAWHFPLYLANGVTGVREMGTFLDSLDSWRARLAAGYPGPRIVAAGHIVDGPRPSGAVRPPPGRPTPAWVFAIPITSSDQARVVVDSLIRHRVDFIKVYSGLSREAYLAVAKAARARGVPFAGHVPDAITPMEAAEAGQRSIEHLTGVLEACTPGASDVEAKIMDLLSSGLPADSVRVAVRALVRDGLAAYSLEHCAPTIESFIVNQTRHVPTLVVLRGQAQASDPAVIADPRRRYIPDKIISRWDPRRDVDDAIIEMMYDKRVEIVGDLHRSGVTILAGTDASDETNVFPGFSLHDELTLLVEAGLEPLEAIQAATSSPASFLGHADSLGTIEVGKLADLVLLNADPLVDIRNTQRIAAVVFDGELLDRNDLDALLAEAEAAARHEAGAP